MPGPRCGSRAAPGCSSPLLASHFSERTGLRRARGRTVPCGISTGQAAPLPEARPGLLSCVSPPWAPLPGVCQPQRTLAAVTANETTRPTFSFSSELVTHRLRMVRPTTIPSQKPSPVLPPPGRTVLPPRDLLAAGQLHPSSLSLAHMSSIISCVPLVCPHSSRPWKSSTGSELK